jgi:pimeloyl-ACP methyl ester carboxylesterase
MIKRILTIAVAVFTLPDVAQAAPSCAPGGYALKHGDYAADLGPCTLNADNYYNEYLDDGYPATNTTTHYPNVIADFAGTGSNGNLMKLTANRVGACPNAAGTCGGSFFQGDDPSFPDNETASWANVALYNNSHANNGKLLVILPGSPSLPKNYANYAIRAAHDGYRVIVLAAINYGATRCVTSWSNQEHWSAVKGAAGPSEDDCLTRMIEYTTEGTTLPPPYASMFEADIGPTSTKDSIHNRLKLLLRWLSINFPEQGWGSYLWTLCGGMTCSYRVDWDHVAIAGHSLGTQNVAHFATRYALDRAIFLAGPHPRLGDSASGGTASTPSYVSTAGATHVSRMYALLQTNDDRYDQQISNHIYGSGLIFLFSGYANPLYVDHPGATFSNTYRLLIGDAPEPSGCGGHSWVAGSCGNGEYESAWDWMLTNP